MEKKNTSNYPKIFFKNIYTDPSCIGSRRANFWIDDVFANQKPRINFHLFW